MARRGVGSVVTDLVRYSILTGSVLGFVTAIISLLATLRNFNKIDEVHVLVNSKYTDVVKRVDQLSLVLESHGIEIPKDKHGNTST
jgi:hypothetical protein